ncbi:MAG: NUDIX hydrolase [Candidatus Paceibacterota bacterium]|jgi:8-oxo-dGTP pyrophosphatase MutT (NUDIX family)
MRTINREIVSAHVYSSDGKLLMARNNNPVSGVVYGDCWKIPGGGVEQGETQLQTLIREVKEEVGIDIAKFPAELVGGIMTGESEKTLRETGERVLAKMRFFTYKVILDKPVAQVSVTLELHEFNEYKWVDLSELKTLKLSPPSIELFTKLGFI